MTTNRATPEGVWQMIDAEKRRDQRVRRISIVAWSVTAIVVLIFASMVVSDTVRAMRMVEVGVASPDTVRATLMPLVAVIGTLSLLIAVLSTVGVFLRLRTASLHEIQLRLSTLEQMLTERTADGRP